MEYPYIVFSNRKQSKVEDFITYLNKLKTETKNEIHWDSFSIDEEHIIPIIKFNYTY